MWNADVDFDLAAFHSLVPGEGDNRSGVDQAGNR